MRILEQIKDLIVKEKLCPKTAKVREFMTGIDMDFKGYGASICIALQSATLDT
ncbi:hypothetical protein H098_08095 [Pseudomonas fluorescens FH5]|nr:hypothetical protein H098_08095 [Pseudomonas fluorescens FH5]